MKIVGSAELSLLVWLVQLIAVSIMTAISRNEHAGFMDCRVALSGRNWLFLVYVFDIETRVD